MSLTLSLQRKADLIEDLTWPIVQKIVFNITPTVLNFFLSYDFTRHFRNHNLRSNSQVNTRIKCTLVRGISQDPYSGFGIRIQECKNDPQKYKKLGNFMSWIAGMDVRFSLTWQNPDPIRIRIWNTVTESTNPSYFSLHTTFKAPNPPVGVPLGEEELAGLDVGVGPRHQTLRHAGAQRQRLTDTRACALGNLSATIGSDRRVLSVLHLFRHVAPNPVLRIRDVFPSRIPDPHQRIKVFSPPKKFFALENMIRVLHNGSGSWIFTHPRSRVKQAPDPESATLAEPGSNLIWIKAVSVDLKKVYIAIFPNLYVFKQECWGIRHGIQKGRNVTRLNYFEFRIPGFLLWWP